MTTWHIVTGEYPPLPGGVSDYSRAVAGGLASAGDVVHVWCPALPDAPAGVPGVHVHPIAGSWRSGDLVRLDREINGIEGDKRLLLQWVPHAYGRRSLNVGFCRWIRRRAKSGDELDLMVHEPGLAFGEGELRHDVAAAVHRLMLVTLLSEARRTWVAIPAWIDVLRPWTLGRSDLQFCWLPVPSTLPVADANDAVQQFRADRVKPSSGLIVGHFSTYPPVIVRTLEQLLPPLLSAAPEIHVELLGRGSDQAIGALRAALGADGSRVAASGALDPFTLSQRLQACDLLVQPYPDGASTRRTTLMAALAHGIPVVTTIGDLSEAFWRESDAIAAVPASDVAGMARIAIELLRQPERRRHLAAAARATYEARFSLPHVIRALRTEACGAVA